MSGHFDTTLGIKAFGVQLRTAFFLQNTCIRHVLVYRLESIEFLSEAFAFDGASVMINGFIMRIR